MGCHIDTLAAKIYGVSYVGYKYLKIMRVLSMFIIETINYLDPNYKVRNDHNKLSTTTAYNIP